MVVDASAILDGLTVAPGTEKLRELLVQHDLQAPHLIDYEIVSALSGLVRGRVVSDDRAKDVLSDYEALRIRRWASNDTMRRRAFDRRDNLGAYDAAYVVLADLLDCPLLTRDRRLARAAESIVEVIVR